MNSIEINGVTKEYRKGVKALDSISFSIGTGVFGLLGHNGAGKTTLMRLITTILRPTEGTINRCLEFWKTWECVSIRTGKSASFRVA